MNLDVLWWLTLGALIGWLVQWVWDWIWFRARRRIVSVDVETQVSTLQAERDKLATDLRACGDRRVALETEVTTLKAQSADFARLRTRVSELEPLTARVTELKTEHDQLRVNLTTENDRLRAELEAAHTATARLTDLTAENDRLRAELEPAHAATARLADLTTENDRLRADLETARLAGPVLGAAAGSTLASREIGGESPEVLASLREYNVAMYDELEASRRALSRFAGGRGDPLIDIDGIGPVYQKKLYDAGVVTFDQVAAMHPERLRTLVAPNAAFEVNTASWSEQAATMAGRPARDPLIDINGIGPVYEQRLLTAGVTSFDQLAAMSPEEIRAIIKPEAWQNIEPEAWVAEARTLAQQVRDGTYRKGRY